jgi:hypothetical protein
MDLWIISALQCPRLYLDLKEQQLPGSESREMRIAINFCPRRRQSGRGGRVGRGRAVVIQGGP